MPVIITTGTKILLALKTVLIFGLTLLETQEESRLYRIATNSTDQITTQGFAIGLNYYRKIFCFEWQLFLE